MIALLSALAFAVTACAQDAPQDSLKPAGPFAEKIDNLFQPVFWIAAAIFFLVEGALVYIVVRYRARKNAMEPPQLHGNRRLEIAWTVAPALLLLGVAIPTVTTIWDLSEEPKGNTLQVEVVGHQWWWEYHYPEYDLRTANELHIPVNRPVVLEMTSSDVIHSFWVPRLAGKQDLIPGRTSTLVIEASEPGEYLGQCAEFCSLSHANMRLKVFAETPQRFQEWVREQRAEAAAAQSGLAAQGMQEFVSGVCIQCHAIRGIPQAAGRVGPDLTHFASRSTFGAATYDLTEENLREWLRDPQAAKPGNKMVIPRLSEEQIDRLVAFLLSLR